MDPRDADIEFDFFEDEPATTEAQSSQSRVRLPRRGADRGPRIRGPQGPTRGLTPLLRLLALISIIVAALVFFGLVIQSCASTSKKDAYKSYMAKVASIAHSSDTDGASVASAMTTSGAKVADLETSLQGIADQERQTLAAAEKLNPPGTLRPEQQNLIEALQLRVNGVQGLTDTFRATASSKASADAAILATQAERLLASDVMWDDLFRVPATNEMKKQGINGVVAPESHFVTNQDLVTTRSMGLVLQRLRGASTSGGTPTGVHGTNIVSTKVTATGKTLSLTTENIIVASPNLGFAVTVHNGGNSQEVGIKVTMTLQKKAGTGGTIVKTGTIDLIDPGQDKSVMFKNVDVGGLFALHAELRIDVEPVPSERDAANNKATYPVIFSLG
ncbi:MAG TPA: hypothetical protein VH210_08205 [Gaiellaceae bacterium]|jgi:hypothetical protein|nr:hypothetical protein [Gaiellaceae bacterium]